MSFKTYFAIEKKLKTQGFDFTRQELISQFTNGKKNGLSDLSTHEYKELIRELNLKLQTKPNIAQPTADALNLQRRKIIALFHKMGYTIEGKADMKRIYSWVLKYGKYKKSLNQYDANEMPVLVTQVEAMYKTFLNGI